MDAYHDRQFDALGDPTRRAVLRLLRGGPMSVGAIADEFDISRPAISQHLRILKDASLVNDTPVGTQRLYEISPEAFQSLRAWLDDFWGLALGNFKRRVESRRGKRRRPA